MNQTVVNFYVFLVSFSLIFSSCSSKSDGDGDDVEQQKQVGVFIDSPVSGIDYSTGTYSGKTDAMGRFFYEEGENVEFSIGDIVLPKTGANSIVHITEIFNSTTNDTRVLNLARLLLTLDEDGNPENGIAISSSAFAAATGVSVDFSSATFENDVAGYINDAVGASVLVAENEAQTHIEQTLEEAESFTTEEEDALYYGCGGSCVQRASYHELVESFYPRHQQVGVAVDAKIELTIVPTETNIPGTFSVELFPIKANAERCRIDYGGFVCGDKDVYGDAIWEDIINGKEFFEGETNVNPLIFGEANLGANNRVVITPNEQLATGVTYVVHIFNDEYEFKTWWIFKT